MNSQDDLLDALGSLPAGDVGEAAAGRIRSRAHVVLEREKRLHCRPVLRRLDRAYSGAVEPALVAGACLVYLYWALSTTLALLH